jgi:hypothetical protein
VAIDPTEVNSAMNKSEAKKYMLRHVVSTLRTLYLSAERPAWNAALAGHSAADQKRLGAALLELVAKWERKLPPGWQEGAEPPVGEPEQKLVALPAAQYERLFETGPETTGEENLRVAVALFLAKRDVISGRLASSPEMAAKFSALDREREEVAKSVAGVEAALGQIVTEGIRGKPASARKGPRR